MIDALLEGEHKPANVAFYEDRLLRCLRVVDARLAAREWLADERSVADFALYPIVALRGPLLERAGGMANLKRWRDALAAGESPRNPCRACGHNGTRRPFEGSVGFPHEEPQAP
jgi:glutathione S-transferase